MYIKNDTQIGFSRLLKFNTFAINSFMDNTQCMCSRVIQVVELYNANINNNRKTIQLFVAIMADHSYDENKANRKH